MTSKRVLKIRFEGDIDLEAVKAEIAKQSDEIAKTTAEALANVKLPAIPPAPSPVIPSPVDRFSIADQQSVNQQVAEEIQRQTIATQAFTQAAIAAHAQTQNLSQAQASLMVQQVAEALQRQQVAAQSHAQALHEAAIEAERLFQSRAALTAQRVAEALREEAEAAAELEELYEGLAEFGVGIFGGLVEDIHEAIQAAGSYAASMRAIDLQLSKTDSSVLTTAAGIERFADQMGENLLTSQEDVAALSNALLTFENLSTDSFFRVQTAAHDMAATMGRDAAEEAEFLAEALVDPIAGIDTLADRGVAFTQAQRALIQQLVEANDEFAAQNEILKAVESTYGGVAGIMAQGFGAAVDSLNEELNDLQRTTGATFGPIAASAVTLITDIIKVFNALPVPIQRIVIITKTLTLALAAGAAVLAAWHTFGLKAKVTSLLMAAAQAKATVTTKALAASQALLAAASGRATAAQLQLAGAIGKTAALAGVATVLALNANTIHRIGAASAAARESINEARDALIDYEVAVAAAAEASGQAADEIDLQALTIERTQESLGFVERALDSVREAIDRFSLGGIIRQLSELEALPEPVRNALESLGNLFPKVGTSLEASLNKQKIAMGDAIEQAESVTHRFNQLKFGKGLASGSIEELGALNEALRAEKQALEDSAKANPEAAQAIGFHIAAMQDMQNELGESIRSQEKQIQSLENLSEAYQESLGRIGLEEARRQRQIAESIAGGTSEEEARQRALAVDREFLQQRIAQAEVFRAEMEEALRLTSAEQGENSEEAERLKQQIVQTSTEIENLGRSLAEKRTAAQTAARDAAIKQIEDAEIQSLVAIQKLENEGLASAEEIELKRAEAAAKSAQAQVAHAKDKDAAILESLKARKAVEDAIAKVALSKLEDAETQSLIEIERLRNQDLISVEDAEARKAQAAADRANAEIEHAEDTQAATLKAIEAEGQLRQALENQAIAGIQRETREQERAQQRVEEGLQRRLSLQNTAEQAIARRQRLLESEANLLRSQSDFQQNAFSIAADLTKNERAKQRLQEEAASARLTALDQEQKLQRKLFELSEKQTESELRRLAVQNRIRQSELELQRIQTQGQLRAAQRANDEEAVADLGQSLQELARLRAELRSDAQGIVADIAQNQQTREQRRQIQEKGLAQERLQARAELVKVSENAGLRAQLRAEAIALARSGVGVPSSSQRRVIPIANQLSGIEIPGVDSAAIAQQLQRNQESQQQAMQQLLEDYGRQQQSIQEQIQQGVGTLELPGVQKIQSELSLKLPSLVQPIPEVRTPQGGLGALSRADLVAAIREAIADVPIGGDRSFNFETNNTFETGSGGQPSQDLAKQMDERIERFADDVAQELERLA